MEKRIFAVLGRLHNNGDLQKEGGTTVDKRATRIDLKSDWILKE
jgi:hypothetical protein